MINRYCWNRLRRGISSYLSIYLYVQTDYIQRGHEHTGTGNCSESGFRSLRGAPLNISWCLGGDGSTPQPYGRLTCQLVIHSSRYLGGKFRDVLVGVGVPNTIKYRSMMMINNWGERTMQLDRSIDLSICIWIYSSAYLGGKFRDVLVGVGVYHTVQLTAIACYWTNKTYDASPRQISG